MVQIFHVMLIEKHTSQLVLVFLSVINNKAVFNQHLVDPTCKLCKGAPENRQHFLAEYPAYGEAREKYFIQVNEVSERLSINVSSSEVLTRLILDPSLYTSNEQDIYKLELHSRELVYNLHHKRLKLLTYCEGQRGLS